MIYLDIDGVVADFDQAVCRWFGRPVLQHYEDGRHLWRHIGLHSDDDIQQTIWDMPAGFWSSIPLLPWARQLVAVCEDVVGKDSVYFATAAIGSNDCASGKMLWIAQHFPEMARRTILIRDKWMLTGPDRILIDDLENQCDKFVEHGGSSILFPQLWNRSKNHVPWRMTHVEFLLRGVHCPSGAAGVE